MSTVYVGEAQVQFLNSQNFVQGAPGTNGNFQQGVIGPQTPDSFPQVVGLNATDPSAGGGTLIPGSGSTLQNFNMASYAEDVVMVLDPSTGDQVLTSAHLMKCNVLRGSRVMDHPLENGSIVSDYRIVLPIEIEMGILVDSTDGTDTYDELLTLFNNATFLTVQTNAGTFDNLIIENTPHDETPDMFGILQLTVRFREILLVTVQFQALAPTDVAVSSDASTIQRGEQTPSTTVLQDIVSGVQNVFSSGSK